MLYIHDVYIYMCRRASVSQNNCIIHECQRRIVIKQVVNLFMIKGTIFSWIGSVYIGKRVSLDSFTVPLHSPNGRHMTNVNSHRFSDSSDSPFATGVGNSGNSYWSYEPIMQWGSRQSQYIFRPTNHKSVMPANSPVSLRFFPYRWAARTMHISS